MDWLDRLKVIKSVTGMSTKDVSARSGIPEPTLEKIFSGSTKNPGINTMQQLVNALGFKLDAIDSPGNNIAFDGGLSDCAIKLARDYDSLDVYGKRQVRTTADTEMQRMREMEEDASNKLRCYIIKKQEYRMSAGTGQEAHSGETEEAELVKRPPAGSSYIARVAGNSMEPTYKDGDWVFVHEQEEPVRKGEIGVFLMDGQQWIKELGDGFLISHNASEYAPIAFSDGVKCQGKVIGLCDGSYFE